MKKPIWKNTLILAFSAFIVTLTPLGTVRAEMVSEEVQEDAISPEGADASSDNQELVIVKKKPATPVARQLPARRVVRRQIVEEQAEPVALQQEPAIEVRSTQTQTQTQQVAVAAQPEKKSVGATVDNSIQNKMDGVRDQFEQALIKQLDKIKITVGDDEPKAEQSAAATQTTIVTDSIVNAHSAAPEKAGYMSIESAPKIAEDAAADDASVDGESLVKAKAIAEKSNGFSLAPILGMTSIGSSYYNISARYTAGVQLEAEIDENLAAVASYSYSQYDIGMANANPFYAQGSMYGYGGASYATLQYNQNVFTGGMKVYLMPPRSTFRAFFGGGFGYNKGFVNYNTRAGVPTPYNPLQNSPDYEVSSFLGYLEGGADFKVSRNVSVGGSFKYNLILTSNENQPLNNYAFVNAGYGAPITDKAVVGGSIARENFYSILGSVKVAF